MIGLAGHLGGEERMAFGTQQKSAELAARLDRLPFSKWHRNLFVLCFLGVMFDACDFALFGMALPPVAREFGLNPAQAGLLATVGLVGAFFGALFWGTISDYIGRRTAFASTIGIFSLFTGLVARRGTCCRSPCFASSRTSASAARCRSR
jgi:putative MFS transporter